MTIPYDLADDAPGPARQRARGRARITARLRGGASRIAALRQEGSLRLLFPHGAGGALSATWLNTAGGITGGDAFTLEAGAEPGAHLTLTSQAAERIYRAQGPAPGRVETRLTLAPGARLDWLPQETILFDGAALDRRLSVEMAEDARFLGVETLIFGRAAMGEEVRRLALRDRIDIRRGGALIHADRLALNGDAAAALAQPGVADGARAMATLVIAAPGAEGQLPALRARLPVTAGISSPLPGLVVARVLAPDGFELRHTLLPLLRDACAADLPRPWML
ncbi:urease accessory protein UreD [Roseivivax sp.]